MKRKGFYISIIIIAFSLFALGCSDSTMNTFSSPKEEEEVQVDIYLDAMSFFNQDKSSTSSEEDILAIYGEPELTEDWNYDRFTDGLTYPVRTLSYTMDNGEYWEFAFNMDRLQRISISDCAIPFEEKGDVLSLFGCKKYSNTKTTDTNAALRYENCGVYNLWAWSIEDNTIKGIKISYSALFE